MMRKRFMDIFKEHMSKAPVDVYGLADDLGIKVIEKGLGQDLSGVLRRAPDGSLVCEVNSAHPETRRRFTIAHEIGHAMLHSHLIDDGIFDTAYRANDGVSRNEKISQRHETEANKFAASLLMPERLVIQKLEELGESQEDVARALKVSAGALGYRLDSVRR